VKIAFSSAAMLATPSQTPQTKSSGEDTLAALGEILNKNPHNPFNNVTAALGQRLDGLNERITFKVSQPERDQIEITLKHAAHADDTVMKQRFALTDVAHWLDQIQQLKDMTSIWVVDSTLKVTMPFSTQVKRLKHEIINAPFYKDGLKPMLQRAKSLSTRQNSLDEATRKRYRDEQARQHKLDAISEGDTPFWRWKSDTSRL